MWLTLSTNFFKALSINLFIVRKVFTATTWHQWLGNELPLCAILFFSELICFRITYLENWLSHFHHKGAHPPQLVPSNLGGIIHDRFLLHYSNIAFEVVLLCCIAFGTRLFSKYYPFVAKMWMISLSPMFSSLTYVTYSHANNYFIYIYIHILQLWMVRLLLNLFSKPYLHNILYLFPWLHILTCYFSKLSL